jgi:hypothetical protein
MKDLFYHWENIEPTISWTIKGLKKPLSHSVLKYFQLGNVHLVEDTHVQAPKHIAWCTCLHLALWENSSYNLDLQITKYIFLHNLWTLMNDPHIRKEIFFM